MSLTEIAVRSAAIWLIGQFGVGIGSVFAATQRLPGFWSLIAALVFRGCILLGSYGLTLLCSRLFDLPLLSVAVFVISGWLSFVLVQCVQNFFYRLVDVPPHRIRWFGGQELRRRARKRRRV